jgi:hypothetical protein
MNAHISGLAVVGLLSLSTSVFANDVDPFGFDREAFVSTRSRAEVVAELKAAKAAGELPVFGDIGVQVADEPSFKPRAQVVAETLEAARLGLLSYGETGPKQATPAQERQIQMAGLRALARLAATKRASERRG